MILAGFVCTGTEFTGIVYCIGDVCVQGYAGFPGIIQRKLVETFHANNDVYRAFGIHGRGDGAASDSPLVIGILTSGDAFSKRYGPWREFIVFVENTREKGELIFLEEGPPEDVERGAGFELILPFFHELEARDGHCFRVGKV